MNPIALSIFGIDIRFYSLFILIGVLCAYFMITREANRFNISKDQMFNMFFWTVIIGILGARIYYVIFNWEYFGSHVNEIWQIWQGGLAIHGGIIAGVIVLALYTKKYNLRTMKILDIIVVPLILAQALGRWGNFFNQEAYGAVTTLSHLRSMHIPDFVIKGMYINGLYYTPTFYYESLWCLLGFIIMLIFRRTRYVKTGQITAFYLIWYGLGRFFIEASRTDSLMILGFKMAQIVSIIFIIIGIVIFIRQSIKGKYVDLYDDEKIR